MPIKLNGSTSGYTQISAPATAGNNTLVLPANNGTSGQYMQTDGSGNLSFANVTIPYYGFYNMSVGTYTTASNSSGSSLVWNSNGNLTWTVPTGITVAKFTLVGGGASGGVQASGQASGGGAGGIAIKVVTGLTPGATIAILIGAGASGGAGGNSTVGSPANLVANGGAAGATAGVISVLGGTATGGTINIQGGFGMPGFTWAGVGSNAGNGGSNMFGAGGANTSANQATGSNGTGYGAGGAGGLSAAGVGTGGLCIIEF